jgi:AbrB family looped-hinge helix DNA binding protein
MKVWSDYRVTIPAKMRKKLGLEPGTELDYTVEGDQIVLFRKVLSPERTLRRTRKKVETQKNGRVS